MSDEGGIVSDGRRELPGSAAAAGSAEVAEAAEAAPLERDRVALRRALIMGTSRRPIDVPAWLSGGGTKAGQLALVAALSVRSRFDRPALPPRLGAVGFAHDPQRLVSDDARSALRRLYGTKNRPVQRPVTLRIVDVLSERGLCLHPFDYPVLSQILTTNDGALDRNARLWRSLMRSGGGDGDGSKAAFDEIDDGNWTEFRPAPRAAFLRNRRRQDRAAARELLAGTIAGETATVRRQLLEAMAVALSADDAELLRSLATDRAESVRSLARALLASIPGTTEFDERMASAHERLELKSAGIIGRRKVLMAKLPKGLAEAKVDAWLQDAFAGVSAAELARRLQLTRDGFVAALVDERLRRIFFGNALALNEHETATAIAATLELPEARRIVAASRDALAAFAALEPQRRSALWSAFAPAISAGAFPEACAFAGELYEVLRVGAPAELMHPDRTVKPWKRWLDTIKGEPDQAQPECPELAIALADRAHRPAWRERFDALSPATASTALALADLFDALDRQSPPQQ